MRKAKKIIENSGLDKNLLGGTAQVIIGNLRYVYLSDVKGVGSFGLDTRSVLKKLEKFLKGCKKIGLGVDEVVKIFELGLKVAVVVRIEDINRGVTTKGLENGLPDVKKMMSWVEGRVVDGLREVWGVSYRGKTLPAWQRALKRFRKGGAEEKEIEL